MIGWENNRDGGITMPLSLKTIRSAGCTDQWNKRIGRVLVNSICIHVYPKLHYLIFVTQRGQWIRKNMESLLSSLIIHAAIFSFTLRVSRFFAYFVWAKIISLRCGAIGIAAEAVAPKIDRNHTADASLTLIPLLFKTLQQKDTKKIGIKVHNIEQGEKYSNV